MQHQPRNTKQSGSIEVIILLAVVILIVGFFGWYFIARGQTSRSTNIQPSRVTQSPQPVVITSDLETEFEGVQTEDLESDFEDLDSDINNL